MLYTLILYPYTAKEEEESDDVKDVRLWHLKTVPALKGLM